MYNITIKLSQEGTLTKWEVLDFGYNNYKAKALKSARFDVNLSIVATSHAMASPH